MDVTYLSKGRLYAVSSERNEPTCLLNPGTETMSSELAWGPQAERVLFASDRAVLPSGTEIAPFESGTAVAWSRPEGKSILGVTPDGRLLKRRTIEPEAVDISFLDRHDEAVYHPAGTHIISVGEDEKGSYGIFLATNVGKDRRQLAISEQARRVYSVVVERAGKRIFYAADHDTYSEVHSLDLESPGLGTLYKTDEKIVRIIESAYLDAPIAIQAGSCASGTNVEVVDTGTHDVDQVVGLPKGASIQPVGWLPNGELVLLSRDEGCKGKGDLYISRPAVTQANVRYVAETTLLTRNVEAAGLRVVAPSPPEPPGSTTDPPVA